jgi:hypothetical protein
MTKRALFVAGVFEDESEVADLLDCSADFELAFSESFPVVFFFGLSFEVEADSLESLSPCLRYEDDDEVLE